MKDGIENEKDWKEDTLRNLIIKGIDDDFEIIEKYILLVTKGLRSLSHANKTHYVGQGKFDAISMLNTAISYLKGLKKRIGKIDLKAAEFIDTADIDLTVEEIIKKQEMKS